MTLVPKSALPLTKNGYLNLHHVVLATGEPEPNPLDERLKFPVRHIACRARSFASAIELACAAHWACNVPVRLLHRLQVPDHMAVVKPVLAIPDFEVAMYWHTQTDKDPGLLWLRACIAALAASNQRSSGDHAATL
jgi:DNA-binding transcriptional LysR family regulator